MDRNASGRPFEDVFGPLTQRHGDCLTFTREASRVEWSLDGESVRVAPGPGDVLDVAFVGSPLRDRAGSGAARPVYRRGDGEYRLDPRSCAHLVDDMLAFFEGVREPRFAFAQIDPLPTA